MIKNKRHKFAKYEHSQNMNIVLCLTYVQLALFLSVYLAMYIMTRAGKNSIAIVLPPILISIVLPKQWKGAQ